MNPLLTNLQADVIDAIKDDDTSNTTLNKLWQAKYLVEDAIRIEMRNRRLTQLNLTTLKTEVQNFQQRYQLAYTNDTSLPVYVETTLMKDYLTTGMSKDVF